jgi:curved DNA-binding protein CbpA
MSEANYYEVLGVERTASGDEIRRAYRRRIAEVHPDKPGGDEAATRAVEEARTILLDPLARARYDAALAGGELVDEAIGALAQVGGRAVDQLTVTLRARGHDLLAVARSKVVNALRSRRK